MVVFKVWKQEVSVASQKAMWAAWCHTHSAAGFVEGLGFYSTLRETVLFSLEKRTMSTCIILTLILEEKILQSYRGDD